MKASPEADLGLLPDEEYGYGYFCWAKEGTALVELSAEYYKNNCDSGLREVPLDQIEPA